MSDQSLTPAEMNRFLAEKLMGWHRGNDYRSGRTRKCWLDAGRTFICDVADWDPYHDAGIVHRDIIPAMEVKHYEVDAHCNSRVWGLNVWVVMFCPHIGVSTVRGYGQHREFSAAACLAAVKALKGENHDA